MSFLDEFPEEDEYQEITDGHLDEVERILNEKGPDDPYV